MSLHQFAPDLSKIRLERDEIDRKREEYISKLNEARKRLTWENFASVPVDNEPDLRKKYAELIAICQKWAFSSCKWFYRNKAYDTLDVNEMALCVYEASLDPKLRPEIEKLYGSGLSKFWNKFHELSLDLRKYYKPLKSTRKEIVTTLDKIYGVDIPMNLNIFQTATATTSSSTNNEGNKEDEDNSLNVPNPSCEATASCEPENQGNDATVYDSDWLFV